MKHDKKVIITKQKNVLTGCPTQDATSGNPFLITFPATKPRNSFTVRTARILSSSGTFVWIIFFEKQWFCGPAEKKSRFKNVIFCMFLPTTFPLFPLWLYSIHQGKFQSQRGKVVGKNFSIFFIIFFCFYWHCYSQGVNMCGAGFFGLLEKTQCQVTFCWLPALPALSEVTRNVPKGCRKW